ncbi:MAG: type II toxin-antitoxin system Phd/YefM family antitoxin [Patescibacteria group bacterium]
MNTKTTVPISEARKNIFKIAEDVQKPDTYYTLTEKGRAKMVVMSADEFDSWQETLEIMANPHLMKEIRSAHTDFEKGRYIAFFKDFLAKEKNVSSSSHKRRAKKS